MLLSLVGRYLPVTENREIPLWAEAKVTLVMRYRGDLTGEVCRLIASRHSRSTVR